MFQRRHVISNSYLDHGSRSLRSVNSQSASNAVLFHGVRSWMMLCSIFAYHAGMNRNPFLSVSQHGAGRTVHRCRSLVCIVLVVALCSSLTGCGVNSIPRDNQAVEAAWAQVQNEYQRRADLVPNLVQTVKGYAKQERETLTAVTEARAKATSVKVDASTINDPQKLQQFTQAQGKLSGALGRLLAVSERYPDLKSNQNFLALQSQLEGTENRITVARRDYIQAVQKYNTELVTFPGRIWHSLMYSDMKQHANFQATTDNADKAPKMQF